MTGEGRTCRSFSVATAPGPSALCWPATPQVPWLGDTNLTWISFYQIAIYVYIISLCSKKKLHFPNHHWLTVYLWFKFPRGVYIKPIRCDAVARLKSAKPETPRSRLPLSMLDLFLASAVWVVQNWRSAINSISGETFWKWGCISIPSWEQDIPWQSHVWWISKQTCKASSHQAKNLYTFHFPFFLGLEMFLQICFMWFLYMLICWINRWSFPGGGRDGFRFRCMREVDTPVRSS